MSDHIEQQLQKTMRDCERDTSISESMALAEARRNALQQKKQPLLRFAWPTAFSLACALLIAIFITPISENNTVAKPFSAELLLDEEGSDTLELYQELEFYYWLAQSEQPVTG